MTQVVNLRKEPYDVYIGRHGHGQDGYYGNPISRHCECFVCHETHDTPSSTIACYREYFLYRVENDSEFKQRILALEGKTLGCFCKPKQCHGDVIVEWLEKQR